MRNALPAAAVGLLLVLSLAGCASIHTHIPNPPINIAVFLREGPVPGNCAAVTFPQLAHLYQGKEVSWHIVNVSCKPAPTVEFEFEKQVIQFEPEQCAAAAGRDYTPKGPVFCFQAKGRVRPEARGRHKYKVRLSSGFVEDPEVDIYPPPH